VDALVQLMDLIGQPVVLMLNSGIAASGWVVADARSKLVKGIVAVETGSPAHRECGAGIDRSWAGMGLTNSRFITIRRSRKRRIADRAPGQAGWPDLLPCWIQKEPRASLLTLAAIPVLEVSGEAELPPSGTLTAYQVAESGRCENHVREA